MKDFREIKAWEKAHALTLAVYRATACFPRSGAVRLRRASFAGPVPRPRQTSQRVAVEGATESFAASWRTPRARPARPSITCCWPATCDTFR